MGMIGLGIGLGVNASPRIAASVVTANLLSRFKANAGRFSDAGSTPANVGDLVYQWNDQQGTAAHLVQTTSGSRPKRVTINGTDAMYWGLAAEFNAIMTMPSALTVNSRDFTAWFVLSGHQLASQYGLFSFTGLTPSVLPTWTNFICAGTDPTTSRLSSRWQILGIRGQSGAVRIYRNGNYYDLTAFSAATPTGGDFGGYNGALNFCGSFREALFYNAAQSDSDVAATINYLNTTYGVGYPNRSKSLVCVGDSLTAGNGALGNNYPLQLCELLGTQWEMYNFGIPSTTLQTMLGATTPIFHDLFSGTQNVCVVWAGTNDVTTGRTAAQAEADLDSYCTLAQAEGYQVVVLTMLPRGSDETVRGDFNTAIRNNYAGYADALADVAADSRIGDAGDYLDTTYYSADAVHLNSTGYGVVAGIVQTAINSL